MRHEDEPRRLRIRSRPRTRRTRRRAAPEVTPLESRALAAVTTGVSPPTAVPQFLPDTPDQRQVSVLITGVLGETRTTAPAPLFFVIDEYHKDEPRGHFPLVPLPQSKKHPGLHLYGYAFTVSLQAAQFGGREGRFYDVFVGATDQDGTGGQYVRVLVPGPGTPRGPRVHPHPATPSLAHPARRPRG